MKLKESKVLMLECCLQGGGNFSTQLRNTLVEICFPISYSCIDYSY